VLVELDQEAVVLVTMVELADIQVLSPVEAEAVAEIIIMVLLEF
jgi:hypothetical protein